MRALLLLVFALLLAAAPVAHAAPTCVDRRGDTIRCGTPDAMPVGWHPSAQTLWERQLSQSQGPDVDQILKVLCGIGLFLFMIALMPDFDGAAGWDQQEGDEERPKR